MKLLPAGFLAFLITLLVADYFQAHAAAPPIKCSSPRAHQVSGRSTVCRPDLGYFRKYGLDVT